MRKCGVEGASQGRKMNWRMQLTFKFAMIRGRNAARSSLLQTENSVDHS